MAELKLRVEAGTHPSWIRQSLDAACRRVEGTSLSLKILSVLHVPEDNRLLCILRAADRDVVSRLFEIALLPSARILEVVEV